MYVQRPRPHRSRGLGRPHGVVAEARRGASDLDLPHRGESEKLRKAMMMYSIALDVQHQLFIYEISR